MIIPNEEVGFFVFFASLIIITHFKNNFNGLMLIMTKKSGKSERTCFA